MTFGAEGWGTPEDDAGRIYAAYRDLGGNFVDTANEIYSGGRSEEILGRLIEGHRHQIVLATKYTDSQPGNDPNAAGNHRKSMVQSLGAGHSDHRGKNPEPTRGQRRMPSCHPG
jgi:aryl-alcohol dehydrogenase-like predicted oxidoreductase